MKSFKKLQKILEDHKEELRKKYQIKEIGIFGSYVRGEQSKHSDVDILIEFKVPIGFFAFLELEEYLSTLLGIPVDLVSKKALKPYIGEEIKKEVVLI